MTQPSTSSEILVAGIGNIFLGDDAFGVEVVRRLTQRSQPEGVHIVDFGIRGIDLAFALLDGYAATILVDATPRGGEPGTLYMIEPDAAQLDLESGPTAIEPHGMHPLKVLCVAKSMGAPLDRILLVGCEPEPLDSAEEKMGLSERVEAAIEPAIQRIQSLVEEVRKSLEKEIRQYG